MPNAARAHPRVPHVTLNSDGQRHPLLNALTVVTLVLGIASFVPGFIVRAHLPACVLGLLSLLGVLAAPAARRLGG